MRKHAMAVKVASVLAGLALAACGSGGRGAEGPPRAGDGSNGAPTGAPDVLDLQVAWEWPAPPPGSAGIPAADGSGAALTTGGDSLVVLDAAGKARWEATHDALRDVAPLLTPDTVVAATEDGVVGYERASGRRRWAVGVGERPNTPVLAAGRAVVSTWEGSLVALDMADGGVAWRVKLGGPALGPAAASGSTVVATFDTGRVAGAVVVDAANGRQRWAVPLPAGGVSAPAVAGGDTVVVVAGDVAVHGLSLLDGSTRWRNEAEGAGSPEVPPLPLADGTVVAAHRQGGLLAIRVSDGEPLWLATSDGAAVRGGPAGPGPNGWFALPLDDGRLFLAHPPGVKNLRKPPDGLVSGVAAGPGGVLLISTGQGDAHAVTAMRGW